MPGDVRRLTALFTKRPDPGAVKTRLCPPLSPDGAARLAEAMLRDAAARCVAGDFRTALVFAPADQAAWFRARFPEIGDQRPQRGAGLGQRLASFVRDSFARAEAATLVVIGSDQPLVPLARLHEAHRRLEDGVDCVLGPDAGGGYYLIGLRADHAELFTEVPMSEAGMCAATARLARQRGLELALLSQHDDVDVAADLARLCQALATPPSPQRATSPDHPRYTRQALVELALLAP